MTKQELEKFEEMQGAFQTRCEKEEEKARKKANEEKIKTEKEKAEYERLKKIYG